MVSITSVQEVILIGLALSALSLTVPSARSLLVLRTDVATIGPRTSLVAARRAIALVARQPLLPVVGPDGPCGLIAGSALEYQTGRVAADIMSPLVAVAASTDPRAIRRLMRRCRLPAIAALDPRGALVGLFVEVACDELRDSRPLALAVGSGKRLAR